MRLNGSPIARKARFYRLKEFEIGVCHASMPMWEISFVSDGIILSWYTLIDLTPDLYISLFGTQLVCHTRLPPL